MLSGAYLDFIAVNIHQCRYAIKSNMFFILFTKTNLLSGYFDPETDSSGESRHAHLTYLREIMGKNKAPSAHFIRLILNRSEENA